MWELKDDIMKRNTEKKLVYIVSFWHFLNAVITIFIFGTNLRNNGTAMLSQMYPELGSASSSLVDNVFIVISTYGLVLIIIGILNIYFLKGMEDNKINKQWQIWLLVMLIVSFITMDVISIFLYLITLIIYNSKNKAIRIQNKEESFSSELLNREYS